MKTFLQRTTYDVESGIITKIIAIPSEFFMSIRSINRKISCAFVSLVMHKGYSFHSGHYYSEVLDFNTGIWVCYGDDRLSQNNYFPEGVYIIEVWKIYLKTQGSKNVLLIIYIRIIYL